MKDHLILFYFCFYYQFFQQIRDAELRGASAEELNEILGRGRAKKGMFEGVLDEGELEVGQVSSMIKQIKPAAEVVEEIWNDCLTEAKAVSMYFND